MQKKYLINLKYLDLQLVHEFVLKDYYVVKFDINQARIDQHIRRL